MRHLLTLEQFLNEGVNDPGILKVFFMAGGPGSGKSFIASELFGFPKSEMSSVSYATGLKLVNNDSAFETMLKKAGYDIGKLADYSKNEREWEKVMQIRDRAKSVTQSAQNNWISGRLGQVVDGTGKEYDKMASLKKLYEDLGYDTYMVFVNTSLEVAQARNNKRARKLPESLVEEIWSQVQENLGKFQKLFGKNNMMIIDNSSYDNADLIDYVEKSILRKVKRPVENRIGQDWIQSQKNASKL
jgi:predicted kinase